MTTLTRTLIFSTTCSQMKRMSCAGGRCVDIPAAGTPAGSEVQAPHAAQGPGLLVLSAAGKTSLLHPGLMAVYDERGERMTM